MTSTTTTSDMSNRKNKKDDAIGINFLDAPKENKEEFKEIADLSAEDLKKFLFSVYESEAAVTYRRKWDDMIDKIDECYFEGVPTELSTLFEAQFETDIDVLLTKGSSNKVREMVRVLTNILLKERPMFEPDPSGNKSDVSEEEIVTATRFLEYVWDRGGLRKEINLLTKQAIRRNRGILKIFYSSDKSDISFMNVDAKKFWFDSTKSIQDSWWYVEKSEIKFYELELSGLFTKKQINEIRKDLNIVANGDSEQKTTRHVNGYRGVSGDSKDYTGDQMATQKDSPIKVYDYYVKVRKDGEIKWLLVTFLEDKILIRKDYIEKDDLPYEFFIPEDEAKEENNRAHSMNDVANASVVSNYMSYKILDWIQKLSDITIITDEEVQVERSNTPGVRTIRRSATGGAVTSTPVVATNQMINQDIFFHQERMERTAENNYGVHPNILQGVNGSTPSNGPVAQTLLANDVQNTSPIAQSFGLFLGGVARKILYIASKTYKTHKVIQIEPTRGTLGTEKIIGEAVATNDEDRGTLEDSGIKVLKMFENINVEVIPSSAYTEAARQQQLINMLQVAPELIQYIPKAELIKSFAVGSANLMMHQAAREASEQELKDENPEVAMAEAENKSMAAGQQRVPQANENHAIHDRVHMIEEQYVQDQLRQSNSGQEAQQSQSILGIIRDHRRQHNELSGAQQASENAAVGVSPSLVGFEEDEDNSVESIMTEDSIAPPTETATAV